MSSVSNSLTVRPCLLRATVDATGLHGPLFRVTLAASPSSTALTLPNTISSDGPTSDIAGMWLDLLARGQAVQYGFVLHGQTAPTLLFDQPVTIGTGDEQAAAHISAGERVSVQVPRNAKQLVFMWGANVAGSWFEGHISGYRG